MKKILYFITITLFVISCSDTITYPEGNYFALSDTQVSFSSAAGESSIEIINPKGETRAEVITENSDWCTVMVTDDKIMIKVDENNFATSRIAKIRVTSGGETIELMVRQARKYFDYIAPVKNLEAVPGPGEVTLKWEAPEEDNFSHVIIRYMKDGQLQEIELDPGVTEYTIKELLNADGEHIFSVQSVDKEHDCGEIVQISAIPGKLVAIRFEKSPDTQWVPYYLRTSNSYVTKLMIGSMEFNQDEEIEIELEVDPSLLDENVLLGEYAKSNNLFFEVLPDGSYTLPHNILYLSKSSFQELRIDIDINKLNDRTLYALPVRVKSVSSTTISEILSSVVIVYCVDDLAGWYTVDRLPKCGEGEDAYPKEVKDRRRYIKRVGETNWETGYLFRSYVNDENHGGAGSSVQYITIDPALKKIHIQQNGYATIDDRNYYDFETNELHIEYLYRDWAGWWNHERMYNRSLKK